MTPGGRRSRARRRGEPSAHAEINVTSLIDVAFTLLVIFIITAPALQGGIELQLPEAQVRAITAQDDPFMVSINAEGTIYISESPFTREEFRAALPQLMDASGARDVYIRGDAQATHGVVTWVMGIAQAQAWERGGQLLIVADSETDG
ncbi:MAG: biopolymer transporter ExbD [Gemmatimonadales bacterium]|nr:MAG: biopolymer transporter ExbD [Gemmatimonadales bacterium]